MSELVFPWTTPQALDSSDRRESRAGIFEADRLVLGRFGTGSGELLRGTSDSSNTHKNTEDDLKTKLSFFFLIFKLI